MSSASDRNALAPEAEEAIEQAHLAVLRCQRDVEKQFIIGAASSGLIAVLALLLGNARAIVPGVVLLVAAIGLGGWLLLVPRRKLAAAELVETQALADADAGSWLGLHLRRLDGVNDPAERKRFETAAKNRAAAQIDWDEIAGAVSPQDLTAPSGAVRAYADSISPQSIARRIDETKAFSAAAGTAEMAARRAVTSGLDSYGFIDGLAVDIDPTRLQTLLLRRIAAGDVARRALQLEVIGQREHEAARRLDGLLTHLGYEDGDMESRLGRAIQAVAAARSRQTSQPRTRVDITVDIERAIDQLRVTARPSWADQPEPTSPPVDAKMLDARHREISELATSAGRPDVAGAKHRFDVVQGQVRTLEQRLEEITTGRGSVQHQLVGRLGRTTFLGDHEESVPVFIDDAFRQVADGERMDLLDLLIRLSRNVQVVLLSDDPVVNRWARNRSTYTDVVLYEADDPIDDLVAGPLRLPASVTIF